MRNIDGEQRTASIVDNMLKLTTAARLDGEYNGVRAGINNPTDYLESTFILSSESDLGENGGIENRLDLSL